MGERINKEINSALVSSITIKQFKEIVIRGEGQRLGDLQRPLWERWQLCKGLRQFCLRCVA